MLSACAPEEDLAPDALSEREVVPDIIEPTPPVENEVENHPAGTASDRENSPWNIEETHSANLPQGTGTIEIRNIGDFTFEAGDIQTLRPDIFQDGHFSLFDILVHLGLNSDIALDYHFDESLQTHAIDAINGQRDWWYEAHYSSGWFETNAFRMDHYPYKNNSRIRIFGEDANTIARIHQAFREEIGRLARNGGRVVIPELSIRSTEVDEVFQDVVVVPHDVRSDVLQLGTVTALDALLSLADQGKLHRVKLTWYEQIARADPVDNYWVDGIDQAEAAGGCGFVYETGPLAFPGFRGSHIHIPSDVRVTISPEYAHWFWICL